MANESVQMPADATQQAINADNIARAEKAEQTFNDEVSRAKGETPKSDQKSAQEKYPWLQDKFSSPEELAKAYNELERKLGTQSGKPKAPEELDRNPTKVERTEQSSEEKAQQKGASFLPGLDNTQAEEISNYAWENRALTSEHYEALENAGYSRDLVNEFMAGQFARQDATTASLIEAGGGEAQVEAMFDWARQTMTEQQIQGYDEMFAEGGPQALMAIENLRAKYENSGFAGGYNGVTGANAPAFETSIYTSTAQVIEAMNDPRYRNDPAYREEVARKLGRSNVL